MKIEFTGIVTPRSGALAVGVSKGGRLSAAAKSADKRTNGAIRRALKVSRFDGKKDQFEEILAPSGVGVSRIILFGLGDPKKLDETTFENIGGSLIGRANSKGDGTLSIAVDAESGAKLSIAEASASVALGARLGSYRFDRYRTTEKKENKPSVRTLTVMSGDAKRARREFAPLDRIADGVILTRDLVSRTCQYYLSGDTGPAGASTKQAWAQGRSLGQSAAETHWNARVAWRCAGKCTRSAGCYFALERRTRLSEKANCFRR